METLYIYIYLYMVYILKLENYNIYNFSLSVFFKEVCSLFHM